MIQTTETDSGTRVTVDTTNAPPRLTIERNGGVVSIPAADQDAIYAIRSGLSRILDAMKGGRGAPEQKP